MTPTIPSVIQAAAESAEMPFVEPRHPLQGRPDETSAPWGLALSGGGIRSATFALGVLQALARHPACSGGPAPDPTRSTHESAGELHAASLLSRFDYLSTVSGGGYVGAFFSSLFLPGRLRLDKNAVEDKTSTHSDRPALVAADDAVRVLMTEPPSRMRSRDDHTINTVTAKPLAWLRDNGRYLAPSSGGDLLYALCLQLRNWAAVHYVIGTVLFGIFALSAWGAGWFAPVREMDAAALSLVLAKTRWIWWSPLWWLVGAVFLFWALPVGLAFWLIYPDKRGQCRWPNNAVMGYFGTMVFLATVVAVTYANPCAQGACIEPHWGALRRGALTVMVLLGLSLIPYTCNWWRKEKNVAAMRVQATRQLRDALMFMATMAAVALIETAGRSLYVLAAGSGSKSAVATPAALIGAVVWLARHAGALFDNTKPRSGITRLPLTTLCGAAGVLVFALIATLWSMAVAWLQWGNDPTVAVVYQGQRLWLGGLFVTAFALAWLTGQFPGFINLSSLQAFYSARLTRAYLGASNGERFIHGKNDKTQAQKQSVAEPLESDQVALNDFIGKNGAPRTLAPFHLINVTVNKTVDPAEQLVQRDRKGQPMVVTPRHFAVDNQCHHYKANDRQEIQRPLSVGQWIGTSGAAFSTGIGRETTLGMSLLMGAANVRLGTWWDSGAGDRGRGGTWERLGMAFFKTQMYLLGEFTAKFHGLHRPWQYLSDGGHFENTALYELLRPERGLHFIIASDSGADPKYEFEDLANLMRLVRIDMGVEVSVEKIDPTDAALHAVFGVPEDFRRPRGESPAHEPCAVLLRAKYGNARPDCWIVMIKPRVRSDSAADVQQYQLAHPRFPQEPTSDQFYDEAQWESYRKLGLECAERVLDPGVRDALKKLTGLAQV